MNSNKSTSTGPEGAEKTFRIGAVSRITQIPVDTLRAWERRYGVVSPARNVSSARLFTEEDVERLRLIKRLVDAGHAISSVANLTRQELEQRLELHGAERKQWSAATSEIETLIVYRDPDAHSLDVSAAGAAGIDVLAIHSDWRDFETDVAARKPTAVVVQIPALLGEHTVQLSRIARRMKHAPLLVVYGFATTKIIERLERDGIRALRAPINYEQLLRELERPAAMAGDAVSTPTHRALRLFDDEALESMAQYSAAVQCECPHHLVDIVRTLNQFEIYSVECENRNDEDAALHAKLAETTATARSLFERALFEVAEYEGIELPPGIKRDTT